MENKYKITITGLQGNATIVYYNEVFKSLLLDFEPHFDNRQLVWFLHHIPNKELMLAENLVLAAKGKITLEKLEDPAQPGANRMIAFFCDLYKEKTGIAYKVSPADAGKIKKLSITDKDWLILVTTYYDSKNFLFVNKWSIANIIKYWNELRVEAFGVKQPVVKTFPLPYDHEFYSKLNQDEQKAYWVYLRANGYKWDVNASRNGKWVKY